MALQATLLRAGLCPTRLLSPTFWQHLNFDLFCLKASNVLQDCAVPEHQTASRLSFSPSGHHSAIRKSDPRLHYFQVGASGEEFNTPATPNTPIVFQPCRQVAERTVWPGSLVIPHAAYATFRPGLPASSAHAKRTSKPNVIDGFGFEGDRDSVRGSVSTRGGIGSRSATRAKAEQVKELHLKPRITEHDLCYKLRQMEGWLADGIRAKVVVEFRSADQSEVAAALVDSVVTRLGGKGQPLGPRQQNKNTWFVILRPAATKLTKQAKQQQGQQLGEPLQQPQRQQVGRDAEPQGSPTSAAG